MRILYDYEHLIGYHGWICSTYGLGKPTDCKFESIHSLKPTKKFGNKTHALPFRLV